MVFVRPYIFGSLHHFVYVRQPNGHYEARLSGKSLAGQYVATRVEAFETTLRRLCAT
jgi:hypothetical protein